MAKLTLSLGSNVGDRQHFLREARRLLSDRLGKIAYESTVIETSPWGKPDQPAFLNQVITLTCPPKSSGTSLRDYLHGLLSTTQGIEAELGRERKVFWGPRTVDIDLIFVDDLTYEDERLSLPHPWWRHRPFVTALLPPGLVVW